MGRLPAIVLALWASVGCRRASDEARDNEPAPAPVVDRDLVEHVLPSVGLSAPTNGPIGTAHPTTLIQAAKSARWVVACQARLDTNGDGAIEVKVGHHGDLYGDVPVPYLIRGGGAGQRIEELVAVSPDERYLVFIRDGAMILLDDTSGRETTIVDADLRADQRGRARTAAFDAESKRLIYFRANAPGTIVIRDLSQPRERVVKMPGVRVWNAMADLGPYMIFRFVRDDTDKNGTLDWPTVNTNLALGEVCRGPALSYSTYGAGGDDVREAWLDVERGTLKEDTSVLAHLPRYTRWGALYDELVRLPDHSVRLGVETIVPATCDAQIGAVLAAPPRVVVVCKNGKPADGAEVPVEIFGPSFHATLSIRSERRDIDHPPQVVESPIFCMGREHCADLTTGKAIAMRGSEVHSHGLAILSRDGAHMYWTASPASQPVEVPDVDSYYPNATAGSIASLDKGIVDVATGRVLGYAPKMPLAIDLRGRVLVPDDDSGYGLPLGPLVWAEPLPQPPPKPTEE